MTVQDLTAFGYKGYPAKSQQKYEELYWRRFIGTDFSSVVNGTGATPADGDTFKIMKLNAKQIVAATYVVVVKADTTSSTVSLGYTNGTNASTTAFLSAGANLNAAGTTYTAASATIKMIDNDGYWVTTTLSAVTALLAATEVVIGVKVIDLSLAGITTVLTNVV